LHSYDLAKTFLDKHAQSVYNRVAHSLTRNAKVAKRAKNRLVSRTDFAVFAVFAFFVHAPHER